ncbi:glucans biosynthesis glucosyltransferase MdoH [Acidithiobacillus thiooxidans]|uniref:glucans biosynthesis glucosyltransferase MdoH n=1 Tax=Acidithiobacillus thiooxidans TaxID=930 RepID=UPI001C07D1F1|nr:glucans biosynthesis glucosyltransferase MdoH [Acidithiobacillus thiooxidans]MBU2836296.1 glucans biosynthesis glucosyltransferase MdoH [Acidithiobacillus thiooxidans]
MHYPESNHPEWERASKKRVTISRLLSFALISIMTYITYLFMLMYHFSPWIYGPFLLAYFSLGYLGMTYFVGMFFGFVVSLRGIDKDPYHPLHSAVKIINPSTHVAIICPIYNEDPRRVGAAIAASWTDLCAQFPEESSRFDFFILSDSKKVESFIQEEWVVHKLIEKYPGGRFVYRHRRVNSNSKSGNVTDFCRRWGHNYNYMIMLDADSIMPGESLVKLTRIMDGNPRIGIVQCYLSMVLRKTLHARISRFISALTLKIGFYGQNYFYMGHGYYYGHNAIIRTKAFMDNCMLPSLRAKGPFASGKPISHDYIEAALMAGSGYEIWSLPQIEGYEELPTNLIDDMKRETRWMYGSMLYFRFFMSTRINTLYKARLFTSAINYVNPILGWIFFSMALFGLIYIFKHPMISVLVMYKYRIFFLFSLGFLAFSIFMKMLLPILYNVKNGTAHLFGGIVKMIWSYLLYFILSIMMAPIYMAQFTLIILYWARGKKLHWGEQVRDDRHLTWSESAAQFGWVSILGVVLSVLVIDYVFSMDTAAVQYILGIPKIGLFFWYIPLLSGLILSVWLVRFLSFESPLVERMGLFMSPQEVEPHFVLTETQRMEEVFRLEIPEYTRFEEAIQNPWFYVRHRAVCTERNKKTLFWLRRLLNKPFSSYSEREKFILLNVRNLYDMAHKHTLEKKNGS